MGLDLILLARLSYWHPPRCTYSNHSRHLHTFSQIAKGHSHREIFSAFGQHASLFHQSFKLFIGSDHVPTEEIENFVGTCVPLWKLLHSCDTGMRFQPIKHTLHIIAIKSVTFHLFIQITGRWYRNITQLDCSRTLIHKWVQYIYLVHVSEMPTSISGILKYRWGQKFGDSRPKID